MTADIRIEQAIYGGQDAGGYRFLARSPGFRDDWLPAAEQLCTGFGERPAGVACPAAVFARPLDRRHVVIVQVADQGRDDAGRPGALGFRLLVLPRTLYLDLAGDPFRIADESPPPWQARGELPALTWDAGPPPPRSAEALAKVLNVSQSATLLGGVQALVDGGRLVFERTGPDDAIVRSLWALLPTSTRGELWPASFAFCNAHRFHVLVVPRAAGSEYDHYLTEEQAGDYPEGRYERNLQTAVQNGDQAEVDALLGRRSRSQTMRLGLALLVLFAAVAAASSVLNPTPPPGPPPTPTSAVPLPRLELPPVDECPPLDLGERARLAGGLQDLGKRLHLTLPRGITEQDLSAALAVLDTQLGTPDPRRDPGPLRDLGPVQRQLRALLWKHTVPGYNERGLNTVELLERLEERLGQERNPPERTRD
jgi:hypothetical protein